MNWQTLANRINQMTEEQKKTDVTVFIRSGCEVMPISHFVDSPWDADILDADEDKGERLCTAHVYGVLDDNHPFIVID